MIHPSKVDIGTLGSTPILVKLTEILVKENNSKTTTKVFKTYQMARIEIMKIKKYIKIKDDYDFCHLMLNRSRTFHLNRLNELEDILPKVVFTHLRHALVEEYRIAKKEISKKRHEERAEQLTNDIIEDIMHDIKEEMIEDISQVEEAFRRLG